MSDLEMYRALFFHILHAFAQSENRCEEYVWQRVTLSLDPGAIIIETDSAEETAVAAVGIWDQFREFDYGDGPGTHACRRRVRARLRVFTSTVQLRQISTVSPCTDAEEFTGTYSKGQIEWFESGSEQYSAPHWFARKPMAVPEELREQLTEGMSFWFRANTQQDLV